MDLSNELLMQFAKATKSEDKTKKETTVYGTAVKYNGGTYVRFDGSELLTPVITSADFEDNERVSVLLKDHTATVTGNISAPSARDKTVSEVRTNVTKVEEVIADTVRTDQLVAQSARIDKLETETAKIGTLEADNVNINNRLTATEAVIKDLTGGSIDVENLTATFATVESLNVERGRIDTLESGVADIDTLIFGSATGTTIHTSFANSVIAQLGDAQIKSAMIQNVSAGKITSGDIITNNVRVKSQDGSLIISDETMQISDSTRVRVQIGKDASGDYSINIWDASGNLMFSKGGITDSAIKEAIIRNDMVSDTANIAAHKLDIDSLFEEINGSTNTIKSTRVYLDDKKQTLAVAFKSLDTTVTEQGKTITSQGTQITAIQGQLESKIWQQDIDTAKNELSTQYSTLEQELSGFKTIVGNTYTTKTEFKNLEIGGRNLLANSFITQSSLKDGGEYTYDSTAKGVKTLFSALSLEPGQYTYSLYMKRTEGLDVARIRLHKNGTTVGYHTSGTTDGKWAVLRIPIMVESSDDVYASQLYNHNFGETFDSSVIVKKLKIERGDKATDWTPAPEDVDTRISSAESSIIQLSDRITANVTDISSLGTKINTVELTADGLTARLDNMRIGGRNLIVRSTETVGRYIGTDGSDVAAVVCSLSVYIPITPSTSYVFTKTTGTKDNYFRYAWYTADKTYIGRAANSSNEFLWTSPSTAYYVRISYPSECEVKFEKGSIATDWSPAPEDVDSDILAAAKTATNYLNFSSTGLVVGNHTASTLGKNVLIDSNAVKIRTGSTVHSVFGPDIIELAKDNESATISMLNGAFKIYYDADNSDGGFGIYGVTSSGAERLAFQAVNENDNLTIGWGGYAASANLTNIYGNGIRLYAKDGIKVQPGSGKTFEINGRAYGENQVLWSGGRFMTADHTATLSAAVSAQPHGIVLVFSQYTNGAAADQSFHEYFIPKVSVANHSGKGHVIHMSTSNLDLYATKYLYISDTKITGHANNGLSGTGDSGITYSNGSFVLRYVIGV